MSEYTKTVYYKVTDPSTAYGSFNELIAAHPEVCVEHPDYNPQESYKVMNLDAWEKWMETGIREREEAIV